MRVYDDLMSSDLPILNAEQYMGAEGVPRTEKVKKVPPPHSGKGPRKRAKTASTAVVTEVDGGDDDDADEKSKRARGRPRLDTKDQNAADRRRTQIRLAQRAYRSRKENAIQNLEKEVQVLQETKEEMSHAFMKLHDYAVSHGILEMIPEFAQELHSTTEKLLMLAKKPSRSGEDDSRAASPERESGASGKSPQTQAGKSSSPEAVVEAQHTTMGSSVWGYTFDNDARIDPALPMPNLSLPSAIPNAITQAPLGYEIITMPTLDNASFPIDPTALEPFFGQDTSPPPQQSMTPKITPPSFSSPICTSLPLPNTMAFSEATFGRRLQRSTVEFAYRLCTMPNPPKDHFAKAFGFCLLFEPIEKIRARLRGGLEKTRQESLNNWRAPFWALGGAGQHQFGEQHQQQQQPQQQDKPVGNQGTADVAKHGFGTNFGLGPFDAKTTDARDRQLDTSMRIMLPGFQGEFFDPEEVEVYLRSRGVSIQPGQTYVTAEIDAAWFEDGQDQQQANAPYDQWSAGGKMSETTTSTTLASVGGNWMGEGGFGNAQAATSLSGFTGRGEPLLASRKRVVTLNVDVLIRELMHNGVCLGRSPAFRPKDVNQAFWKATRSDGSMHF